MAPVDEHMEVVSHRQVARDTFLLVLKSPEVSERARPGQFVMIRVRAGLDPLLRRPFSISGVQGKELVFILYRVVGAGTALLTQARQGDHLQVLGPLGSGFDLPGDGERAVMVGGGIGVAPLMFLAQHLDKGVETFLTGYRSQDEVIEGVYPGLESLEQAEVATDDGTRGFKGMVTDLLEERLAELGDLRPTVFACGPPAMLKQVVRVTREREMGCQVSLEANMACGLGACQGCAVRIPRGRDKTYHHVCRDGPVFWSEQIDWGTL